jgi:hypothetical protein
MDNAIGNPTKLTADQIAELSDKGGDISRFFANAGKIMPPIHCANAEPGLAPPKDIHGDKV